jgi:D-alanyl-D-alanine carboxypeptidase/D-alanyl-D-alanine-endopeptidase (penicillin-binding protein 4)
VPKKAVLSFIVVALLLAAAPPAHARAAWKVRIDRLIGRKSMGVSLAEAGTPLYRHHANVLRTPASNQKMLMSMALLDRLGLDHTFETTAAIRDEALPTQTYTGNLWLIGSGDPTLAGNQTYGTTLPFDPTHLGALAKAIREAGITTIDGRVMGSVEYFDHDWWAYGWKSDFPTEQVAMPTALSVNGNLKSDGDPLYNPERRAAEWLTNRLKAKGVTVTGKPGTGVAPMDRLASIASVTSAPLSDIVSFTNRHSHNWFAEMLGKLLGAKRYGPLGTIDKGADAIQRWASNHGAQVSAYDSSGLSYGNRIAPTGMVQLLGFAETRPWGKEFRQGLAAGGQGTMKTRELNGIRVRVKTGTLNGVSTLSGYVFLKGPQTWAEFSIMSRGLSKAKAMEIENKIVRLMAYNAG